MNSKKGQLTVFVIIGIIILISIFSFIFLKSWLNQKEIEVEEKKAQEINTASSAVKDFVEQCIFSTAKEAILENSWQGGYFLLPEHATQDLFSNLPYHYYLGQDLSLNDDFFATELGAYVDNSINFCLQDFKYLNSQGYNVTFENSSSEVVLTPKGVIVKTAFPLLLSLGEHTKTFDVFQIDIPAEQFYEDLLIIREIAESMEEEEICLTCFSDLAYDNDLFVDILPYYNNTYVFDIVDNNYLIKDKNYHLQFAVQYNGTGEINET